MTQQQQQQQQQTAQITRKPIASWRLARMAIRSPASSESSEPGCSNSPG